MPELITAKINVTRIEKHRLFEGKNGKYLDLVLVPLREPDQYGNDFMVCQSITKEERQAGKQSIIIGNAKVFRRQGAQTMEHQKPGPESYRKSPPVPTTPTASTDGGFAAEDDVPF